MVSLKTAVSAFLFSARLSGVMACLGGLPVLAWLYWGLRLGPVGLAVSLFPPACAGLAVPLVALFSPTLAGDGRLEPPLTWTFPTLFCAFALLFAKLTALYRPPLVLLADDPRGDQVWSSLRVLVPVWIGLNAVLAFSAARVRPTSSQQC